MLALKLESLDFESRVVSCAPYRVQRNSNRELANQQSYFRMRAVSKEFVASH
jgi:hypothetical protein